MGIAHAAGVQSRSKRADEVLITRLSAAGPAAVGLGESVRLDWLTKQKKWDNLITLPQTLVTLYSVFPVSSEVDPATLDVLNYQLLKSTDSPEWENMRQLFLGDQS
jgi:hypothetical protein